MGVGAVGSRVRRADATPPAVVARRTYDDLLVDDLTTAHDGGLVLVGRPGYAEGMRVVATNTAGRVRVSRRLTPPEGLDGPAVPAVARTADGYAVSSGGWVGILAPDLTVETKSTHPEWNHLGDTRTVAAGPGVVVAHEYNLPNHVSVTVTGYDANGNHRWHRRYGGAETARTFGFLVADPDGVVVGGINAAIGGLWTAGLTPGGDQRWSSTNTSLGFENDPAAVFDDGLVVFGGTRLRKLDATRSVVWERSYGSFGGGGTRLVSLPDGGTLAGTGTTIGAFGPDGRLRWVREYEAAAETLGGLLVLRDGEYVAAGARTVPGSSSGWFLRLSSSDTPMPTPPPTPTPSPTPAPTPTASPTPTGTPTPSPTPTTGRTPSDTSIPGFGPAAAFAALAGVAGWLRRRGDP